jgi:hypothetical protein
MHILKGTGIDWCKRRLISKSYMDQSVTIRLEQLETRSVKTGRRVRQGCCLSQNLFKLYSKYLTEEAVEGFGDFKIGVQVICTVKYPDDFVLLAKEETVLQGMIHRLAEIGRCYGMAMNKKKLR